MTEPAHLDSDRDTAADLVPIPDPDKLPAREDAPGRISLNRRQSRTIVPPRKWRKLGLSQLVCPECRAVVPSVQDGFWHLQTVHNQGKGVDLEAWGRELRDELDEYIAAAEGRRGLVDDGPSAAPGRLAAALIGIMVLMVVFFGIYLVVGG